MMRWPCIRVRTSHFRHIHFPCRRRTPSSGASQDPRALSSKPSFSLYTTTSVTSSSPSSPFASHRHYPFPIVDRFLALRPHSLPLLSKLVPLNLSHKYSIISHFLPESGFPGLIDVLGLRRVFRLSPALKAALTWRPRPRNSSTYIKQISHRQ